MICASILTWIIPSAGAYGLLPGVQWRPFAKPGNMLTCTCLDEWNSHKAYNHQGLCVKRSIETFRWQSLADQLLKEREGRIDVCLQKRVVNLEAPKALLQNKFQEAALGVTCDLPAACAKIVYQDALALASAAHKVVPDAQELSMKLELFGKHVCSRWHSDNYICRSIVSYNCAATQYTENSNVNFEELCSCGDNDCIILDKSRIRSVNVGDLVMMKGSRFPGKAKGLVHKSPEVCYSDSGDVQARIVLKVDIEKRHDIGWYSKLCLLFKALVHRASAKDSFKQ